MRSKGSHGVFAPTLFPSPAAGEGPSGQIAAYPTHSLDSVTSCYRFAVTPIKCAAGTLRAYLRRRTDDAFASFVSSRSLSVRGSWGTAPSVFWYGAPSGAQGPPGKGGAAERWRVAYPIGIATRHGAQPATTRTHKRNATPARRTYYALYKATRRRQATTNLFQNSFASFCRSKRKVSAASGANRHPLVIPPRRRREEIMA
jgi:hypothetical protein